MHIEYVFDGKTGDITLSVPKGMLNEPQQNALKSEITRQQNNLINQFTDNPDKPQYFRPGSPIPGLPENVAFKYVYKQSAPRSVVFNMSWEDTTPQLTQNSASVQEREKEVRNPKVEVSSSTKAKVDEELKPQDWTTLFLEDLDKQLSSLPTNSLEGTEIERTALNHAVAELQRFLVNKKDVSLLLFSAYLHLRVTHFWRIDRPKADFFLLAARPLEVKTNEEKINIQTLSIETEARMPTNNGQQTDSFEGIGEFFRRIFQRFF